MPAAEALLAASGPATPSIAPWPNSCGRFDSRRSAEYDRNVGISEPPAGTTPSGNPIAVPRSHGFHDRRQSVAGHPHATLRSVSMSKTVVDWCAAT